VKVHDAFSADAHSVRNSPRVSVGHVMAGGAGMGGDRPPEKLAAAEN
jgi:hypothetical protein